MNKRLRAIAAALGVAAIGLGALAEPLISGLRHPLYHWGGSASQLFGPVVFDLVLFWTLLATLLLTAERAGRWRVAVWVGVLILLLPRVILTALPEDTFHSLEARLGFLIGKTFWATLVLMWFLLVALWRPRWGRLYNGAIAFFATVLAFGGISGVLLLGELGWSWYQAAGLNDPRPLHATISSAVAGTVPHRLIWIVMDELSQDQVFDHRYPGLQLPSMEQWAQTSTVFTQVVPAGFYTELAVPGLFIGEYVDETKGTPQGNLVLHYKDTGTWQPFDGHNTIFDDALRDGASAALAGWYNPYCRIMSSVLTSCMWTNGVDWDLKSGMTPGAGFLNNAVILVATVIGKRTEVILAKVLRNPTLDPEFDPNHQYGALHLLDYQRLAPEADRLLLDRSAGFVFLHLPIPHPGGIYDRVHHRLSTEATSTYIDNLVLADDYLGHVRNVLEQSGQWDSSNVVVMGDHSWRTPIWKKEKNWADVEEKASGGKFDSRPFYLVKLAGQHTGAQVGQPYEAIHTRALLDELLNRRVQTPGELRSWTERISASPPQP